MTCSAVHLAQCRLDAIPSLVKEGVNLVRRVDDDSRDVVGDGVGDDEFPVVAERVAVWILPCVELGAHRRYVHRMLDDVEVSVRVRQVSIDQHLRCKSEGVRNGPRRARLDRIYPEYKNGCERTELDGRDLGAAYRQGT